MKFPFLIGSAIFALYSTSASSATDPIARGLASQANANSVKSVPNFLNAAPFISTAATDNGPAINSLITNNPNRPIQLPCGTFNIATGIAQTTGRAYIQGMGENCTILNYTGTGTAYTANSTGGNANGWGLRDLRITTPGITTGTVGIQVGDPSGVGLSQGQFFTMLNVRVDAFDVGMQEGSGSWAWKVDNSFFNNNNTNLYIPATNVNNSGEELNFTDTTFSGSTVSPATCINIQGGVQNINFKGGSFDNCNVTLGAIYAHAVFNSNHFETPSGSLISPFVTATKGHVTLDNPDIAIAAIPTVSSLFTAANSANIVISGLYLESTVNIPSIVSLSGASTLFESGSHHIEGGGLVNSFVVNNGTGIADVKTGTAQFGAIYGMVQDPYANSLGNRSEQLNHALDAPQNLITQSKDPSGSAWGNYGSGGTTTPNTTDVLDPIGTNTAFKFVSTAANSGRNHRINLAASTTGTTLIPGEPYESTGWFKTSSGTATVMQGTQENAATCTVTTTWTRCFSNQTIAASSTQTVDYEFYLPTAGTIYGYGLQTVHGSIVGPVVNTTTAPALPTHMTVTGPVIGKRGAFGSATSYSTLGSALHLNSTGTAPVVSNCGTSPSITGTDLTSTLTVGTGSVTTCTVSWATPFNTGSIPDVQISYQPGGSLPAYAVDYQGIVFTFPQAVSGVKINISSAGHDAW